MQIYGCRIQNSTCKYFGSGRHRYLSTCISFVCFFAGFCKWWHSLFTFVFCCKSKGRRQAKQNIRIFLQCIFLFFCTWYMFCTFYDLFFKSFGKLPGECSCMAKLRWLWFVNFVFLSYSMFQGIVSRV